MRKVTDGSSHVDPNQDAADGNREPGEDRGNARVLPPHASRHVWNGLRAGAEKAGANGLAEAFGGGANGLLELESEPAPTGSQLGRLVFDPRSASSQ